MSEMFPERPLIPDDRLAHLREELENARRIGGQEAVDDVWSGIDRYTTEDEIPEVPEPLGRRFPEDYSDEERRQAAALVNDAADNVSLGLAQLLTRLGPPPPELLKQHRKQTKEE